MVDANIRTIKVPISDISSVQNDGSVLLRYRVVSKDKKKNSHWSRIYRIPLFINDLDAISSLAGTSLPILVDGHPSNAVTYDDVDPDLHMQSSITKGGLGSDSFVYSWAPDFNTTTKDFDVYLSWKTSTAWTDWTFAGTTSSNSFSFQRPFDGTLDTTYQYVQAAVTVSAFPKLTNIGDNSGIKILLSISSPLSTWISTSGTFVGASFPIPVQTASISGNYVTVATTGTHGFSIGQQVAITGVTPSGYNLATRTITSVTSNTITWFDASPPAASITVAGTVTSRNIGTITGLVTSFPLSPSANSPIDILVTGLTNFTGGGAYTGRVSVIDKSGTQVTVITTGSVNPASTSLTMVRL